MSVHSQNYRRARSRVIAAGVAASLMLAPLSLGWTLQATNVQPADRSDLGKATDDLVAQLMARLSPGNQPRVAVLGFITLKKQTPRLGLYLAEELSVKLFRTNHCQVVERNQLNSVLKELGFSQKDLIDEQTARAFGRFKGVDVIVIGTVTDLGDVVNVNAKWVSAETGVSMATATTRIALDQQVKNLMTIVAPAAGQ